MELHLENRKVREISDKTTLHNKFKAQNLKVSIKKT